MDCPACGAQTNVLETRKGASGAVRRRRSCPDCGERFTTHEQRVRDSLYVIKRSGRRQRFDHTKLRAALLAAAHKRPVAAGDVEELVERIESETERAGGEISAERVGELCLEGLSELDPGAYLQFAGVYRDGKELDSLVVQIGRSAGREAEKPPLGKNPANRGQTAPEVRPIQRARSGVTPKRRNRGDG
ncbi:MAG: transcriptional repressor NrdR [Solirubrobacterales bacterium]|jgi:transcriptional repressor NrdR|nr:transcriptional repressor NrdR [Solirubrobacterales bacterium]MEA2998714.1 transcriptional repressor NrdR [Sphingomonadales bacterium]